MLRRLSRLRVIVVILLGLTCLAWLTSLLHRSNMTPPAKVVTTGAEEVSHSEGGGVAGERQVYRHLLDMRGTTTHAPPSASFIKLEGVDATGNDMFFVHGANVAQLKLVCVALEDCEGFNSEGWIKSRVSGKKRATIDLYLKQIPTPIVAGMSEPLPDDQAAQVFLKHLTDYSLMEDSFKIYVYQTDIGTDIPSLVDYKYGVETLFISLLAKSKFRTMDPSKATLFFIPSRCTAYRKSVPELDRGINKAASIMRDMVTHIKQTFLFWNQSLGTDHFYICAHDMGTEVAKLADRGLWKNSIGLVNTADYSEQYFIPHKDISLPPHPGRGTIDWSLIGQGGATFDPYQRTWLAFMAGNGGRGVVRPLIYQHYRDDPDFHLVMGHMKEKDYISGLKTSKFCLCPRGNKAWSPRVMDALWFGCIPVFLADHYHPPLYGLIPWHSFSISIPEQQVDILKVILQNISPQRIAKMQHNILKIYHHLTWHNPPQPYDAFHAVLYQLWTRRHTQRTHPIPLSGVLR